MNEIEKEIEEMARIIKTANEISCVRTCDNCEYYEDDIKCISFGQAIALYNAGYRNVKDKVVLSKEELNMLIDNVKKASEIKAEELKQARKETAREIFAKAKDLCKELENKYSHLCKSKKECMQETCRYEGVLAVKRGIYELAKEYGVEVE